MRGRGIAPTVLAAQIESAAPWLMALDLPAIAVARRAAEIEERWARDHEDASYFELLLAAHFLTVATFCPTDVDVRIRHHIWVEADAERLALQLDLVDVAAAWDPRPVSARPLDDPSATLPLSGHEGEWLSVWAGALGRALLLDDKASCERIESRIEASLAKQARRYLALERECERDGDAAPLFELLRAGVILAHNAGDLSRVAELWSRRTQIAPIRARYVRLGHEKVDRFEGAFARAGAVNKALTAVENHRFLALRAPRALRRSRELLLPIGPFFDEWGRGVARALLEERDLAEVVDGLLETHLRGPDQQGCLRALSAIHQHAPGGLDGLAHLVPARMRKLVAAGSVRDAMKTPRAAFEARYMVRARAALQRARVAT